MSTKTKTPRKAKGQVTAPVAPAPKTQQTAETAPPKSIRQTIRQGILAGTSVADLTAVLKTNFPASQAAAKPAKHIAHYRCLMKREKAAGAVQATAE